MKKKERKIIMISNNIEELRTYASFAENDMNKYFDNLKSTDGKIDQNNISSSQLTMLEIKCIDYIETMIAIYLAKLESNIESGEMSFDIPIEESEIDGIEYDDIYKVIKNIVIDEIKDEDILKVIKNNRSKLCNRLCVYICKDLFSEMFGETIVNISSFLDDPDKLSEKIALEMLKLIYEFAKSEEK